MAITFSAIFARKHGAPLGYAVIASFGSEIAVFQKFAEISDPSKGAEFRAEHAEVQLIRAMAIVDHLDFPDPAVIEGQRIAALQKDAQEKRDAARKAAAAHKEAQARAKAAANAFGDLTQEQHDYLAALDKAEQAAAAAARKAETESEAASKAEAERVAAAQKAQAAEAEKHASTATASLEAATNNPATPAPLEPPVLPLK